jgi:signal transduction histidine kinase
LVAEVEASTEGRCPIAVEETEVGELVRLDESLVSIILANLLSNAVKYSPAGVPVLLSIRMGQREISFGVCDRGIGIPKADQAGLFTTFHRGSNVGNVPGTGLGLTIVKQCCQLHRATIVFTSLEGQGSTFTVRFPI